MVIVEKSFPRGGLPASEAKPADQHEKIIFGATQKKLKKPKAKKDTEPDLLDGQDKADTIETISAELLSYDTIQDGMNIMGRVRAVDQLYLTISLPGRMTARVTALEVSDAYTKATREFLQNADAAEAYKSLAELFHIGQIVYGRIQEVISRENSKPHIKMSLKPAEVHTDLVHSNIKKGFMFNGAIEEVQEHGYIIESGVKGLRSFVPIEKSQPGHVVGELIYLKVDKITQDKAASTCICKEIKPDRIKIKKQAEANIDYVLPSTIVHFKVTKTLRDGLQGSIMNEAFTAYINEHQLSEPLALPEDFEVNSTLEARVLYVMPLTKLVYLTLNIQSVSATADPDDEASATRLMQQFKRGDVVENARVHHLGTGGIIVILNNKYKGIISYKTIKANYKGNYDQDELLAKYSKKSKHKVRVLDFDLMDSLYICTDNASLVNEKFFALDDLKPGDFVTAVVKHPLSKVGGYTLQLGKVTGIIEKLYLAPTKKSLEEGSKIKCRVVAVSSDRNTVYLTNRPEYMSKQCKVLASLPAARENSIFTGTIVQIGKAYLLVKFFNHLKGVLHKQRLNGYMANEMDTFYEGQTMQFRIVSRTEEQITLGLADDTFSMGEICPVTVVNALESGLEIKIPYDIEVDEEGNENIVEMKGLVPIRLLSDFADLLHAKLRMHPQDTPAEAVCVLKNIFSLRDVDYFKSNVTKDWRTVQPGDILKAYVKNVTDDVVELMLPVRDYSKLVKVHLKMLLVTAFKQPNIVLAPEQVVYVKVLSKEQATKTLTISAKLVDVWDGQLSSTAAYVESYLNEIAEIKRSLKRQGHVVTRYAIGDKVSALFQGVHADTNDWQYELADAKKISGIVKASIVGKAKPPPLGERQECVVLWVDYATDTLLLSNKPGDIEHITKGNQLAANLVGKTGINAKVLLKHENIFVCSLKKGQHPLVVCPLRLHFNDFENSTSASVKEGDFCKLAFIHETKPIAVLESTWKLWQEIGRKRKVQLELEALNRKKVKLDKANEAQTTENVKAKEKKVNEKPEKKVEQQPKQQLKRKLVEAKEPKEDPEGTSPSKGKKAKQAKAPEAGGKQAPKTKVLEVKKAKNKKNSPPEDSDTLFYEDKAPNPVEVAKIDKAAQIAASKKVPTPVVKPLPGISNFWTTDLTQLNASNGNAVQSSDEEDDDDPEGAKESAQRKKKPSAAEKFKQQRDEEARLRAIEEKYADPKQLPESVDQFDRLVLSDPNNSKHWINYMVFHLQSTEIDKARAVAQRAIKSISFRDSNEQLNIWIALLNLELRYGTKETYDSTLKEALTYNEPLKVYLRTVEILSEASNKTQELMEMITVITRKFKGEADVWRAAANAYFTIGQNERAQQLLHKAVACLPEREHVNTIVSFANLNHKHGQQEMAQTLLDQVVTSYPKRVDVWTQYVDMLVKDNHIDSARAVLERAVIQKLPLKKMRTIFKKYLEFEERFGTDTDVQKVKQLATEYVKNNTNL